MVKIGLIGFGTVGCGLVSVLRENKELISKRAGQDIELVRIADVDISRKRAVEVDPSLLRTDAYEIINDPEISIVVEAIGGVDPALKFILSSIENGKHVVTTNKEVIAKHGLEILEAAKRKNVAVLFEGSVGGGIPVICSLRNPLSGNKIEEVFGIVNGTTNYILSRMTNDGTDFGSALKLAQKAGYAEADPKNDVDGYDSSYKAAILASVAFGAKVKWEDIYFEGISRIVAEDIEYAKEMGYVIKLLAVVKKNGGRIDVRVHPTLISKDHPLASVNDQFNAIYIKGNAAGQVMLYGEGAGGPATASSVVSDLIEIVSSGGRVKYPEFKDLPLEPIDDIVSSFYVRLKAKDMPGVLAGIAGAFGNNKVSIQSALQKETVNGISTLVIVAHDVKEKNLRSAILEITGLPAVSEISNIIRVESEGLK